MWSKKLQGKKRTENPLSHDSLRAPLSDSYQVPAIPSPIVSSSSTNSPKDLNIPLLIAQARELTQCNDLPVETMVDIRLCLFDALTIDFRNMRNLPELNDAIVAGESLIQILPSSHKDRSVQLDRLAFIKASRYNVSKNQSDIDDAISLAREALSLVSTDGLNFASIASNLAYNLSQRYKATKSLYDLNESIHHTREAVRTTTTEQPANHGPLLNLGARLHLRFQTTGDLDNSNEALTVTHQVLQLSKPGSPEHSGALVNLGVFVGNKYEKTGFWKDLEEAIRLQKACMNTSTLSPESHLHCRINLASLYGQKYERTKDVSDMKEAVYYQYETVQAIPVSDSMQLTRGQHFTEYLRLLTKLARVTTEISDFGEMVSKAANLLNSMPEMYADILLNLRSYGDLLSRKYELTGHPMDLQHNVTSALAFASQSNRIASLKGEPRPYDTNALLCLYHHALKLVTEPQGDPLVVQVVETMHKEYLNLVKPMAFADALIKLEKEVSINVQIVVITSRARPLEDRRKECNEKVEYAKSLGAKTHQFRFKMVDYTIQYGKAVDSRDLARELSESLANCTFVPEGTSLTRQKQKTLIELNEKLYSSLHREFTEDRATAEGIQTVASNSELLADLLRSEPKERSGVLDRLSGTFLLLYEKHRAEHDLIKASSIMKESLNLRPRGDDKNMDDGRIKVLSHLAHTLRSSHVETKDERILEDSMTFANEIVSSTTPFEPGSSEPGSSEPGSSARAGFHISGKTALAKALRSKYFLNGDKEDLDRAIEYAHECFRLQPQIPWVTAKSSLDLLNQFALLMRSRFDERGELKDLEIAIEHVQGFLNGKGKELSPRLKTPLISNLGMLYEQKCERTKAPSDIQKAIQYSQEAMGYCEHGSRNWRAACINLGSALLESYFQSNNFKDLTRAVEHARMAVDNPLDIQASDFNIFLDAAIILKASYSRTQDFTQLEEASEYLEKSVFGMPLSHTARALCFYEYGKLLEELHCLKPSEISIDRAVEAYKSAFNCPLGKIDTRLSAAYSAARLLSRLSRWDDALHSLKKATERIKIACPTWLQVEDRQYILSVVPGLPADTAAATLQASIPNAYTAVHSLELSRGIILGSSMDYRSEVKHLEAMSPDRFREWNHLCMELDTFSQGKRADERTKRRSELSIALAEITRAVRQIPDMETFSPPMPHGSLAAYEFQMASPEIFGVFNALQREFDSLPVENEGGGQGTKRYQELSLKLNGLKSTIRSIAGFEDFLLPLPEKSLLDLARQGPIIIISCSALVARSDAFVIQPSGIDVLRLPMLHHADVERRMAERDEVVQGWSLRKFPSKNTRMRDVLGWLWKTVVKPVLSHLDIIPNRHDENKPRVYWIGTGRLSTAPFHAAGEHRNHSTENTVSHVVSTYIPTLRALSYAREISPGDQIHSGSKRHLFIANSASAPGAAALPSVTEEISRIIEAASPHASIVCTASPTPKSVLSELPLASIAHFACHAISDAIDLANSHLLLYSPLSPAPDSILLKPEILSPVPPHTSSSQDQNKLTVRSISATRSPSAELAYLSACSTAELGKASLADESIHIASAFQLAGFRNVVGTLWQAKDDCCTEVAGEFYRELFQRVEEDEKRRRKGKGREMGEEREVAFLPVAEVLHDAVLKLREKNPEKVLAWAPFVCFGA